MDYEDEDDEEDNGSGNISANGPSLPRATVTKLIKEILPEDVKCSGETIDLILSCCVEFIQIISTQSNEICTNEAKKMIAPEHIVKSLEALGFNHYVQEAQQVINKHKTHLQEKPKKGRKRLEHSGIPHEELLRQQQQLFEEARSALKASQEKKETDS